MSQIESRSLNLLMPGESGIIKQIRCKGELKRRLIEMGLMPGERVEVIREAPLSDPIHVRTRCCDISLRKKEASSIEVEIK